MIKKIAGIILCLFFSAKVVFAGQTAQVAGTFYSSDPKQLETQVEKFLQLTQVPSLKFPRILLVPHAGYEYSGAVAGQAYSQIQGSSAQVVVVLGVAHHNEIIGAAVDGEGNFETPLGKIEIDKVSVQRLLSLSKKFKVQPAAFKGEHSVEVQLPFLQKSLPSFKLVPILMQHADLEAAESIGKALAVLIRENEAAGRSTLLVISSDFSHYPSREDAQLSDLAMLKPIESVDPEKLFRTSQKIMKKKIPNLATTMCNEAGILAGLYAAKALGIDKAQILQHATSAESPLGKPNRVVGYVAGVFYDNETKLRKDLAASLKPDLTAAEKKSLLDSARSAVSQFVLNGKVHEKIKLANDVFNKPQAVFVTIKKKGELRGCVGTTFPKYPLKQAVLYYAVAAATQDSRFPPVTKEELSDLSFEISILSAQRPVKAVDEIRPGIDGVILKQGDRVGLFLPQVWKETNWNTKQFLSQLAEQKAGLAADAWKDPRTQLFTFTVDSFDDSSSGS